MKSRTELIEPGKWSHELQADVAEAQLHAASRYEVAMEVLAQSYLGGIPFRDHAEPYFEQLLFRPIQSEDFSELNRRITVYLNTETTSSADMSR